MENAKPKTLLEQIQENWKWIEGAFEYEHEFLVAYWKDGCNHWHVKAYKLDEHTTEYKGRTWTAGWSLRRKDWDELQQVADRCKAAYEGTRRRDPHMISPRKQEQYVRRMAGSPEGFRRRISIYHPDEWNKYQQFHPPKWMEEEE